MSHGQYELQRVLDYLKTSTIPLPQKRDFQLRMHQKPFVGLVLPGPAVAVFGQGTAHDKKT